ncbi:hypothetical protein PIB30_005162 [Stylosanthes scabra]|uniref:Uncharacterized protein n=1 Tax=Stylosanthes scabra TaxID=79078 RepID=A0ABU6R2R9_9FABA|nr:hypothetical protein [Stylosanthes scabra]
MPTRPEIYPDPDPNPLKDSSSRRSHGIRRHPQFPACGAVAGMPSRDDGVHEFLLIIAISIFSIPPSSSCASGTLFSSSNN